MSKRFLIVILVCVLGLVGVYAATSKKDSKDTGNNSAPSNSKLSNHVTGKNAKKVTLVEYGDFQCPACGAYFPVLKQVKEKYANDIQFQFRNFPLSQIHQNARASSRAAEAASKQGKFWEMHDLLYEQQSSWESSSDATSIFEGYAQQIGLNITQYKTDFSSTEVNATINADYAEGTKLGVNSTPTFFLQGEKITEAPKDLDGFVKLIDQAIKDAAKQ